MGRPRGNSAGFGGVLRSMLWSVPVLALLPACPTMYEFTPKDNAANLNKGSGSGGDGSGSGTNSGRGFADQATETPTPTPTPTRVTVILPNSVDLRVPAATLRLDQCWGPIHVVAASSSDGVERGASTDVNVTLRISGAAGGIHSLSASSTCDSALPSGDVTMVIPAGESRARVVMPGTGTRASSAGFYLRTMATGAHAFTATADRGLGNDNLSVTPNVVASKLVLAEVQAGGVLNYDQTATLKAGLCSQELRVYARAPNEQDVAQGGLNVTIGTGGNATVYTDNACNTAASGSLASGFTVPIQSGAFARFYVRALSYPLSFNVNASAPSGSGITADSLAISAVRAVAKLAIVGGPTAGFGLGSCDSTPQDDAVYVEARDVLNIPFFEGPPISVTLSFTQGTGSFHTNEFCQVGLPQPMVMAAERSPAFYVRPTGTGGSFTIEVASGNLTKGTKTASTRNVVTNTRISGPASTSAGVCTGPYELGTTDFNGNAMGVSSGIQIEAFVQAFTTSGQVASDVKVYTSAAKCFTDEQSPVRVPEVAGRPPFESARFYIMDRTRTDREIRLRVTGAFSSRPDTGLAVTVQRRALAFDPSFNPESASNKGQVLIQTSANNQDSGHASLFDGEYVVSAGTSVENGTKRIFVTKLDWTGRPETTFAGIGQVVTSLGAHAGANAIALHGTGAAKRYVVAGFTSASASGPRDFAVVRYDANGVVDTTFGGSVFQGRVAVDFAGGDDEARAIAVLPNGEILVAGTTEYDASGSSTSDMAVVRLNANGGVMGTYRVGVAGVRDEGNALAYVGGKVLLAGSTQISYDTGSGTALRTAFALACFQPDGGPCGWTGTGLVTTLDGTMLSHSTLVSADFGDHSRATAAALQGDKLVLIGDTAATSPGREAPNLAMARFLTVDGRLDGGQNGSLQPFGANGLRVHDLMYAGEKFNAVGVRTDGRLAVGGQSSEGEFMQAILGLFDADGAFDNSEIVRSISFPLGRGAAIHSVLFDIYGRYVLTGIGDGYSLGVFRLLE